MRDIREINTAAPTTRFARLAHAFARWHREVEENGQQRARAEEATR